MHRGGQQVLIERDDAADGVEGDGVGVRGQVPGPVGRTRPGNTNIKRLLGTAAMAAVREKDSYLAVCFRRLAERRRGRRAVVAVMHKLAIAIWHVLSDHTPYRELGADHFAKRDPERAIRRMIKEADSLGLTVRFDPIEAT